MSKDNFILLTSRHTGMIRINKNHIVYYVDSLQGGSMLALSYGTALISVNESPAIIDKLLREGW
jgi:hypothetical protein